MTKANIVITFAIALLTISIWAFFNRPEMEPPWPEKIQGFSFMPFRADQDPIKNKFPTEAQIDEDLALLAGKTHAVRTYSMEAPIDQVPRLAQKYDINVSLGAWISQDYGRNEEEIERLIQVASTSPNVVRVFVGNESILRGDVPIPLLISYLRRVRNALHVPVSTAEPWHIWKNNPELAENSDFLGVHLLPYWEGVPVDLAIDYSVDRYNELKSQFPEKPIIIGEVGWPSNGRIRGSAVASPANEAKFLRRFLKHAEDQDYIYYLMEAFDQPWKRQSEGGVGAYWGVYNIDRKPKFPFFTPVIKIPEWRFLAAISVVVAAITLTMLLLDSQTLNVRGRSFLAAVAFTLVTVSVWATYDYVHQYITLTTVIVGVLIVCGIIGVMIVLLTEAHEWAEALWVRERRRPFRPIIVDDAELPMASVHVPIHNEPPEMVMETLDALARMDYPRYEVIVVDNNTKDPAVWQPVSDHCERLGPRFRFFHVDPLAGYKAGALNFALQNTDPEAEVIGVIDSDYVVAPQWLRDLVPQFKSPNIAIVQAPQDYRDGHVNAFKAMCFAEYRGFFFIGMITRNERNAIIQHGTMTLIRRKVLQEVNGWSEWCITEDAELGIRIFENGYEALYIPKSYGKGLIPDTFIDYKRQRFRWAYGAVQIMRRHAGKLSGLVKSKLTFGQRYHFWAGWLPWLSDGVNLLFTFAALVWSMAMIFYPKHIDPPMLVFSVFPLMLFGFKIAKLVYLYRGIHIVATLGETAAAAFGGLALSHTIAKAILSGLFTSDKPFFRTPKMVHAHAVLKALDESREEILLMAVLWIAAAGVAFRQITNSPDLMIWIVVLLMQSLPYVAAMTVSMISAFPASSTENRQEFGPLVPERK